MKNAVIILCGMACFGLITISAGMNYRFGASFGRNEFDAVLYGGGAALADILKAAMLVLIGWVFALRKWGPVFAGVVLWVICLVFSLTSGLGFLSLNRSDAVSVRGLQSGEIASLQAEQQRLNERLNWYPKHRPFQVVDSELRALRENERWRRTGACNNATLIDSIAFCRRYAQLRAERDLGKEVLKIEQRLRDIRNNLRTFKGRSGVSDEDPQAALLSRLLLIKIETVRDGLIILMAILLEAGSSLGLFVVLSFVQPRDLRSTSSVERFREHLKQSRLETKRTKHSLLQPSKSVSDDSHAANLVQNFLMQNIEHSAGVTIGATALYEVFLAEQTPSGQPILSQRRFGEILGQLGYREKSRCKTSRRIQYHNLDWKPREHICKAV